ncbi:MAG: class I SAM-dependent methyltransferase [Acidimicrobiia bacterium]
MENVANIDMAKAWDGDEGVHWAEHADRYDASVAPHDRHLQAAAAVGGADQVLDVGCGCGASTRLAARAATDGGALGVDLSSRMLDRARRRAADEGLTNVRFEQADAQVHPFPDAAFDVVISRFGAMFFADPVAAFANIGRAMRHGGRLALLSWRSLADNEWLSEIRGALAAGRDLPEPPLGAPGPFGLAGAADVHRILDAAGFTDVVLGVVEEPVNLGADAGDAFGFLRDLGITRGLLDGLDEAATAGALDELRVVLAAHDTGHGVLLGSSAWLITARRP